MILSSVIIQCSSFSESEFLELKDRIGLLEQNFSFNKLNDDELKNEIELLKFVMRNQYNDLDESKC
jgi:hypothetical protein